MATYDSDEVEKFLEYYRRFVRQLDEFRIGQQKKDAKQMTNAQANAIDAYKAYKQNVPKEVVQKSRSHDEKILRDLAISDDEINDLGDIVDGS